MDDVESRSQRESAEHKEQETSVTVGHERFTPCSQDMTICGDCGGNRAKKRCPRLKEWLAKKED